MRGYFVLFHVSYAVATYDNPVSLYFKNYLVHKEYRFFSSSATSTHTIIAN
jgi:hypothetical protein